MRIAITGGDGFLGGHLADRLRTDGHDVVVVSRRTGVDLASPDLAELGRRLEGCEAVVLTAGINRELGRQTYGRVHVSGTRFVVEAAKAAGVRRVVLVSFLRAREDGPTEYHRSKWVAEGIVRRSGLPFTIVKPGVIFGRGDHLVDHLTRALGTFPVFGLMAGPPRLIAPTAVTDVVRMLAAAALGDERLADRTIALIGPERLTLDVAVRRVASVLGRRPWLLPLPLPAHLLLAWICEQVMHVPLISLAQVRILDEGAVEVLPAGEPPPADLAPTTRFDQAAIRTVMPTDGGRFGPGDLRCCRA